jgi:hypothetical protein
MYLLVNEADVAVGMQEGLVGHALHDEVLVAIDLSFALALPSGLRGIGFNWFPLEPAKPADKRPPAVHKPTTNKQPTTVPTNTMNIVKQAVEGATSLAKQIPSLYSANHCGLSSSPEIKVYRVFVDFRLSRPRYYSTSSASRRRRVDVQRLLLLLVVVVVVLALVVVVLLVLLALVLLLVTVVK